MKVHVELLYTDNLAAEYSRDRDTPSYTKVHEFDVDEADFVGSHLAICEHTFAAFNRGSGKEDPALDERELRSMSMGDIVKLTRHSSIDWTAYICASRGFDPIESWGMA